MGCQSGSDHSHPMVSVMSLLLNLLFFFCIHLLRLRYLTVCLIYMLYGFVALNLIWLYNCWHIYIRLPTYEIAKMENLRTPFAMFHLPLFHPRFSSSSFSRSLFLPSSFFISYLYLSFLLLPLRISTLVSLVVPHQIGIFHIL